MSKEKTFVFLYTYGNKEYAFTCDAKDVDDAIGHVRAMGQAVCVGDANDGWTIIDADTIELPGGTH